MKSVKLYLCPVCRAPRRSDLRDHISGAAHVKIALSVGMLCGIAGFASGPELALRCSLFYLPLWMIAEFFHWVRMREATKCGICGFDPILYRRDFKKARTLVEERLNKELDQLKAEVARRTPRSAGTIKTGLDQNPNVNPTSSGPDAKP